jgi:hypothetical protein
MLGSLQRVKLERGFCQSTQEPRFLLSHDCRRIEPVPWSLGGDSLRIMDRLLRSRGGFLPIRAA